MTASLPRQPAFLQSLRSAVRSAPRHQLSISAPAPLAPLPVDPSQVEALDPAFYGSFYADLRGLSDEELRHHHLARGLHEQRHPNAESMIAELEQQFGPLPPGFDEEAYRARYPDVVQSLPFHRAGAYHYLRFGRLEGRNPRAHSYDTHYLHLVTNRIYDLPKVVVHPDAPPRVNVLVPAFDFQTMSAGFFGVFQVAKFIAQAGFRVRLVMFDNFYWNEAEFREKLLGYPGMETLFDDLEICYIGERLAPLEVSARDSCVATVWYSAYFAEKIMKTTGQSAPFLYLIQDYETDFFPGSSLRALADRTYSMNYRTLFSSDALRRNFLSRRPGAFARPRVALPGRPRQPQSIAFNNACASYLPERSAFLHQPERRRLAFYSRPQVHRNMFELGALALAESVRHGILSPDEWDFYGVGIGDLTIDLGRGALLQQLPRMNLRDYQQSVATFDLGLCLMASPHPSLLPFDLGGSGALVVTNTYGVKDQRYFDRICRNVIAREPSLDDLLEGLQLAAVRSLDRSARYEAAFTMKYPREWEQTFGAEHRAFIRDTFRDCRAS